MERAGFKMIRLIIWQKTNPVPLNSKATYLTNSREIGIVGVKAGSPTFNSKYNAGVYSYPIPRHKGRRIHPTQKPLDLFQKLVQIHSKKGDVVIDPFLGSGTTAVAALLENRKFAGSDIDAKYVKKSKERIKNEVRF
jgi:DNA modification methylase